MKRYGNGPALPEDKRRTIFDRALDHLALSCDEPMQVSRDIFMDMVDAIAGTDSDPDELLPHEAAALDFNAGHVPEKGNTDMKLTIELDGAIARPAGLETRADIHPGLAPIFDALNAAEVAAGDEQGRKDIAFGKECLRGLNDVADYLVDHPAHPAEAPAPAPAAKPELGPGLEHLA